MSLGNELEATSDVFLVKLQDRVIHHQATALPNMGVSKLLHIALAKGFSSQKIFLILSLIVIISIRLQLSQ